MSVDNVPDNEIDTIAFTWASVYRKVLATLPRKWWQFWRPGVRSVLSVDPRAWHYLKELEATSVETIIVCQTVEQYTFILDLQDTVPEQFDYPAVAIVPALDTLWWCQRHRARVVNLSDEDVSFIQNFIIKYGEPENV